MVLLIQTEFSIKINPNHSDLGFIRIDSDWKFGVDQYELGLIRIDLDWKLGFGFIRIVASNQFGLGQIDFLPFFIKRIIKCFSDWFGMIRIGSDTDIGIVLIGSEWIPISLNLNQSNFHRLNQWFTFSLIHQWKNIFLC